MGLVIMTDTGIVKFFNVDKGFGFVKTKHGDVRIAGSAVGTFKAQLVPNARITLSFVQEMHKGKAGYNATRIQSVIPPEARPEPITVLAMVDWFDAARGYGFVKFAEETRFEKQTAILWLATCEQAGFLPERDDVLKVKVNQKPDEKGPVVSHFWHGAEVQAEWDAKMLELYGEDCDIGDVQVDETPASDPFSALFEQHAEDTMRDIGQMPAVAVVVAPAEPEPKSAKVTVKKTAAKPKKEAAPKPVKAETKPVEPVSKCFVHAEDRPNCALAGPLAALKNGGSLEAAGTQGSA